MKFKFFEGLLQIAVALSVAEWMTKHDASQQGLTNQLYSPDQLLGHQMGIHRPVEQQYDYSFLGHRRLVTAKEQSLLQQLLSLDDACSRGDLQSNGSFTAWPLEENRFPNYPVASRPSFDDFGYASSSGSNSPFLSSPSPPSVVESIFRPGSPQVPGNEHFDFSSIDGSISSCGATGFTPSSNDFEDLDISDLVQIPEHESFNFGEDAGFIEKHDIPTLANGLGFKRIDPLPEKYSDDLLSDAGKSPSLQNVNFYSPGRSNSSGEYDPFLLDFGLSGASSGEEDFPDDLAETLSTFNRFHSKDNGPQVLRGDAEEKSPIPALGLGFPDLAGAHQDDKLHPIAESSPTFGEVDDSKYAKFLPIGRHPTYSESCTSTDNEEGILKEKKGFFSSFEKSKTVVNTGSEKNLYKGKGARPKTKVNLPYTEHDLIHMPVDKFTSLVEGMSPEQALIAKDLRRKGKNKIAARNCRKRKIDAIDGLEDEILQAEQERDALVAEQRQLEMSISQIKGKTDWLYDYIFDSLRDENGLPYSRQEFSLQYTSDGSVYLVPNHSSNRQRTNSGTYKTENN